MAKETKRYLVTYADGTIGTKEASTILGTAEKNFSDGVSFLETESVPAKADVLHFESLGISSVELSADEVQKIKRSKKVLAVEEDAEMSILEYGGEDVLSDVYNDSFDSDTLTADDHEHDFNEGYNKALMDVFSSLISLRSHGGNGNGNGHSELRTAIPPVLVPPRLQPIPWNINMVRAPQAWARGIRGEGVKVAVLDTGIAAHPDLVISGGISFVPGVTSFNDGNSHGTHCAGIIGARNNFIGVVGVAPRCNLYAVKVLSDAGSGSSSWIIAGMEWCVRNGMKVASMSLGGTNPPMVAYANAVRRCQDNGVVVVIASGNSFGTPFPFVCAPANSIISGVAAASPVAVAAVNSSSLVASFSSRGGAAPLWNQVTVSAPGVSVNSTVLAGGYGIKSGTSMACPHVAGLAALVIQRFPGLSPLSVKNKIRTTSTDLGVPGIDITYGSGLINCDKATL